MSLTFWLLAITFGGLLMLKILYSILGGWGLISLIVLFFVWSLLNEAFE